MQETVQKWTTNPKPSLSTTIPEEKGGIMEIVLNGTIYKADIDKVTGTWSWTPDAALADGPYNITFRVIDDAGNYGDPTQLILHVDTTAPSKPEILRVLDDEGSEQSWLMPGAKTDDKTPVLSGYAEPGSIVRLYDGSNEIGSAKAAQNGRWEITPATELSEGTHSFTVTSTDRTGHTSKASDAFSLIIESPPVVGDATITYATDDVGTVTGMLGDGAITDDTTPTLNGTANAGSDVRIQYRAQNGSWTEGGLATLNGTDWTWTPNPALTEGKYEFRVNDGSGWSDEFKLEIDLTPEDRYEITHAYDDFGSYTGELGNGAITDDRTPTLHGRGEANSVVYIHCLNLQGAWVLLESVTVGADGQWRYDPDLLDVGNYQFSAESSAVHDANAKSFGLKIVPEGSFAPTIDGAIDNAGPIAGFIKNNALTDDTTPTLTGTAEANSLVVISYKSDTSSDDLVFSVVADFRGKWTFTPDELTQGLWEFNVKRPEGDFLSNAFNLSIVQDDSEAYSYGFDDKTKREDLITGKLYSLTQDVSLKINSGDGTFMGGGAGDHYNVGEGTLHVGKNSLIEFQLSNIREFSFSIAGAHGGTATVIAYDTSNKILSRTTYVLKDNAVMGPEKHDQFTFNFNNQLLGKIEITHTDPGFFIDHLKWYPALNPNQILDVNNNDHSLFIIDDANPLSLNISDVLTSGQKDLYIDDGKTQLMVNGKADDILQLDDILPAGNETSGWTALAGTVTIAGCEYQVYSNGDAELLVQEGVKTELV
ncbi:Ig-like domain-containing protein [Pantoea trifolii]|uniref:Ig-like domain-containing protein n=1 Tax=Pantoea trifolii TaxID=2968030 RepID=A0ABT1VR25_9GAMM|nr:MULTISPECIES: Ig-like domain-containing protein [unclassified Pantoea]MCQ8229024.1 Ig-like domain-containing protein [Pantoea sp. MMK2]MCQ8237198.1 Ig-like domain-containing protein [Pantoea sp. MMK3]